MIRELSTLLLRDLDGLRREVRLYPDDQTLWKAVPGLPNSGGNLALHLVGNLRHFIGATLGHTGYVRDRDAEFAAHGVARADIGVLIDTARAEVDRSLSGLDDADLDSDFPLPIGGETLSTRMALLHLLAHLGYHLGQVDYHRRAATGSAQSAGAVAITGLGRPSKS
jgi:hypothetical protein